MPTLPTLTVTQEQADRMMVAFGSIAAYKEWLKQQVINYVIQSEAQTIMNNARAQINTNQQALASDLAGA